ARNCGRHSNTAASCTSSAAPLTRLCRTSTRQSVWRQTNPTFTSCVGTRTAFLALRPQSEAKTNTRRDAKPSAEFEQAIKSPGAGTAATLEPAGAVLQGGRFQQRRQGGTGFAGRRCRRPAHVAARGGRP